MKIIRIGYSKFSIMIDEDYSNWVLKFVVLWFLKIIVRCQLYPFILTTRYWFVGLVVGAIYIERLKNIKPAGAVDDKKLCK